MYIKQIDMQDALKLAANGREVLAMIPEAGENSDWETEIKHTTLNRMLDGVMFFLKEPNLEELNWNVTDVPELKREKYPAPPNLMEAIGNMPLRQKKLPANVWGSEPNEKR